MFLLSSKNMRILVIVIPVVLLCCLYWYYIYNLRLLQIQMAKRAKVEEVYRNLTEYKYKMDSRMDRTWKNVLRYNSHDIPENRQFYNFTIDEMCDEEGVCVPPFVKIRPLLTASKNHKLATCLVQKSMSTVLSAIFCFLTRPDDFIKEKRDILKERSDIKLCENENKFRNMRHLQNRLELTEEELEKWMFILVTRDPVDRFLSGFCDRCIRVQDDCFGCGMNMTCLLEKELDRAQQFATERFSDDKDMIRSVEDIHMFPQNWRCDLQNHLKKYNFIRYSSDPSGTLWKDLEKVLKNRNVSSDQLDYIRNSLNAGRTAHSTVQTKHRKFLEQRLRSSPYLMEKIVRLFYFDYKFFNYPLPTFT